MDALLGREVASYLRTDTAHVTHGGGAHGTVSHAGLTQFVFAVDDDPLGKLNALIGAGGHPIGFVGARIGGGTIEYHARPFVEYRRMDQRR